MVILLPAPVEGWMDTDQVNLHWKWWVLYWNMMSFVLKMMSFVLENDHFCIENDWKWWKPTRCAVVNAKIHHFECTIQCFQITIHHFECKIQISNSSFECTIHRFLSQGEWVWLGKRQENGRKTADQSRMTRNRTWLMCLLCIYMPAIDRPLEWSNVHAGDW